MRRPRTVETFLNRVTSQSVGEEAAYRIPPLAEDPVDRLDPHAFSVWEDDPLPSGDRVLRVTRLR